MIKRIYAINVGLFKAIYSTNIFITEFSYFILLHNIKDRKNMIINTSISYFMMTWLGEITNCLYKGELSEVH